MEEKAIDAALKGENQFVTFFLGGEEYAIEAVNVQEITGLPPITKVPYLPDYIKGVINLRGTVIPVVDLRLRFGFESIEYTKQTCAIVARIGRSIMGMIVDAVSEVTGLPAECIDPTPAFGNRVRTDFMKGVGKLDKRLLIILNAERVFTEEELSRIETSVA